MIGRCNVLSIFSILWKAVDKTSVLKIIFPPHHCRSLTYFILFSRPNKAVLQGQWRAEAPSLICPALRKTAASATEAVQPQPPLFPNPRQLVTTPPQLSNPLGNWRWRLQPQMGITMLAAATIPWPRPPTASTEATGLSIEGMMWKSLPLRMRTSINWGWRLKRGCVSLCPRTFRLLWPTVSFFVM